MLDVHVHTVRTLHFTLSKQGQEMKSKLQTKAKLLTQAGMIWPQPTFLDSHSTSFIPTGTHQTLSILFG